MTYRKLLSVSSGGQAQTGSLVDDAVTQLKSKDKERAGMIRSASQSIANNTSTVVDMDTESFDIGGLADIVTNRFTIPAAPDNVGLWVIHGTLRWAQNATGYRSARVDFAGVGTRAEDTRMAVNGAETRQHAFFFVNDPGAADVFELRAFQNSGAALGLTAEFSIFRLW